MVSPMPSTVPATKLTLSAPVISVVVVAAAVGTDAEPVVTAEISPANFASVVFLLKTETNRYRSTTPKWCRHR